MNTLQRIKAIQKHFKETPKEQILSNMKRASFNVADCKIVNNEKINRSNNS